jgi:flagellar motor switch protein FliG
VLKSEDYRAMAGPQKAAIFMLALGEEQCTRLFAMMHEDEIKDDSNSSHSHFQNL